MDNPEFIELAAGSEHLWLTSVRTPHAAFLTCANKSVNLLLLWPTSDH